MSKSIVRDNLFGAKLGRGIDGGSGNICGEGTQFVVPTAPAEGQSSSFSMKRIESTEDLCKTLGLSVDAEASFGLFGGSDKFNYAENQKVHNYHLYLMIHTVVTNGPLIIEDVKLKPGVFSLAGTEKQRFHEQFGDFFVLGTQTGGEYFALLDIHTSDASQHTSMSNELDAAGFGGGIAFSAEATIAVDSVKDLHTAETNITEFQIGGEADDQPTTAIGMITKAEKFRTTVAGAGGVPFKLLLQGYEALDLPAEANFVQLETQKDVIADCFQQRTTLKQGLHDVEFILANSSQFEDVQPGVDLNLFRDQLSMAINSYSKAASTCLNDFRKCEMVSPAPPTPNLSKLPARKPGLGGFNGTWVNEDHGAQLQQLIISVTDAKSARVEGKFQNPSVNAAVANANADFGDTKVVLEVDLVSIPGSTIGLKLVPPFVHNLKLRLDLSATPKLSVEDEAGNVLVGLTGHLFTFLQPARARLR